MLGDLSYHSEPIRGGTTCYILQKTKSTARCASRVGTGSGQTYPRGVGFGCREAQTSLRQLKNSETVPLTVVVVIDPRANAFEKINSTYDTAPSSTTASHPTAFKSVHATCETHPCVRSRGASRKERTMPRHTHTHSKHTHTHSPHASGTYWRELTLGNEDDSRCASRSTPWTSAQSSTFPMESDRRNRRRTRDPSTSRSMSVAPTPPPFAADSGGSCPSSAAFRSRLRRLMVEERWWGGTDAWVI